MPLLKTTENDNHYHIAYYLEGRGGITSTNDGHKHDIIMTADPEGQIIYMINVFNDLKTGMPHAHGLEVYLAINLNVQDDGSEEKTLQRVYDRYQTARELEEEAIETGAEAEKFLHHEQWNQQLKNDLIDKKRAAITVNRLEEKMDTLFGYQRQNRTDITFSPMEGGDQAICDILNHVVKNILEQCYYPREESKVFENQATVGKGVFNVYMDFDQDYMGQLIIEKYPWNQVYFARHEKEDLSDCDYVVFDKWYTEEKIKGIWPEKFDKLVSTQKLKPGRQFFNKETRSMEKVKHLTKDQYFVMYCYEKKYKRVYRFVNTITGEAFDGTGWSETDIKSLKTIEGFKAIKRITYKIQKTISCWDAVLEDKFIDEDFFPVIPVYAKRNDCYYWGKVKSGMGLQDIINKTYSQFVDILNKMTAFGYFYDSNTFPDEREKKKFLANVTSPGFVQEVANSDRLPQRWEGIPFPAEIVNALMMLSNNLTEVMNIKLDFANEKYTSGDAFRQKIIHLLSGNDYLFENLSFAKKHLGRIILKYIQKFYTAERVLRIISNQARKEEIQLNGVTFDPADELQQSAIMELLSNADLSKYDVIITESSYSPTIMMSYANMLTEMARAGIPIPPQAIMEYLPIPNKEKIIGMMQQQMEMRQQQESMKYQTELAKSQIAAESKQNKGNQ